MALRQISAAQARRTALAAQGFGRPVPPGGVTARQLLRVVDDVAVVQIDSVNVLTRSHYLPFYSRLGPYDRARLDALRDQAPRRLVEYWVHEASLIAPDLWPLLGFRMRRALQDSWGGMQRVVHDNPELVAAVAAEVQARGPLTSRELERALAHDVPRSRDDWGWNWSAVKNALEHLFWSGVITSAGRTSSFERRYAPLERVLPAALLPQARVAPTTPELDADRFRALVERSARAIGIGTAHCVRDYVRLRPEQANPAIATLVDEGVLEPVQVEGWRQPAYRHVLARSPRRVEARAFLSPFDSLIWTRPRVRALFGFDYRLEIYTPAAQRRHGYYVLPLLLGDRLVARADLKADRQSGVLRVHQLTWEHPPTAAEVEACHEELTVLAAWLGLDTLNLSDISSLYARKVGL